jgi:DNA-binding transcriptional regulator YhcF (GntR family)
VLIVVDLHSGVPAYRQLMDQIRFQIASGVLQPGEELPSTRALSAQLALNPMTISKAYALLQHDGVLERRRGQTLTVAAAAAADQRTQKLDHLRRHLAPAATAARQMGVPPQQALRLFRELLNPPDP